MCEVIGKHLDIINLRALSREDYRGKFETRSFFGDRYETDIGVYNVQMIITRSLSITINLAFMVDSDKGISILFLLSSPQHFLRTRTFLEQLPLRLETFLQN